MSTKASRPTTPRKIAQIVLIVVAAIVALAILVLAFELVRVIVDPSARA